MSYRDVEELLAERGVEVDHVTVYRWVQRFTPLLAEASRHAVGDRWQVDERTSRWPGGGAMCTARSTSRPGHRRPCVDTPRCPGSPPGLQRAIGITKATPVEVVTDRAPVYPLVLEELLPVAWHCTDQCANNRIETDHGRVKARLRSMRGLKQDRNAGVVIAGHAFVQNPEEPANRRLTVAFDELALVI